MQALLFLVVSLLSDFNFFPGLDVCFDMYRSLASHGLQTGFNSQGDNPVLDSFA